VVLPHERGWETRQKAASHWPNATVVSAFLPRNGIWQKRIPTMTVKVPVIRPLYLNFW
jgi:hypothetical protein